jgi:hypothetical protein
MDRAFHSIGGEPPPGAKPWDYNIHKMRSRLEQLRDRYFRPVIAHPEGHLVHMGDCETHRAMEVYKYAPCTCGLLHDLRYIDHTLAKKILPSMDEDESRQDAMIPGHRYWLGPYSDEEKAKMRAMFEQHFPAKNVIAPTPQEYEELEKRDWSLIEEVFGKPFRERMEVQWNQQDGIE